MEYTDKEIQSIADKAYAQAINHALKLFRDFPYLNALKMAENLIPKDFRGCDLNEIKYITEN